MEIPPRTLRTFSQPSVLFAVEARRHLDANRAEAAIEICKRGLARYPEQAAGYVVLAAAYRRVGDERRAELVLRRGRERTGVAFHEAIQTTGAAQIDVETAANAPELPRSDEIGGSTHEPERVDDSAATQRDVPETAHPAAPEVAPSIPLPSEAAGLETTATESRDQQVPEAAASEPELAELQDTEPERVEQQIPVPDPVDAGNHTPQEGRNAELETGRQGIPHPESSEPQPVESQLIEPQLIEPYLEGPVLVAGEHEDSSPDGAIPGKDDGADICNGDIGITEPASGEDSDGGYSQAGEPGPGQGPVGAPESASGGASPGAPFTPALPLRGGAASGPSTPAWFPRRSSVADASRPSKLALHTAKGAHRMRSANLRLIPGLEFAPLRHEDPTGRTSFMAPIMEDPLPEWTLLRRAVRLGDDLPLPEFPPDPGTTNAREQSQQAFTESTALSLEPRSLEPRADSLTGDSAAELSGAASPLEQHAERSEASEPVTEEDRLAASTNLDELAKRLQGARIKPVADGPSGSRASFEPPIVSDTLAEILVSQGAYFDALKAFQTLARMRPEKLPWYEERIAEMKKLIASGGSTSRS